MSSQVRVSHFRSRSRKSRLRCSYQERYLLGILKASMNPTNQTDQLAHTYGAGTLVILPRDPLNLFAYWEIPPASDEVIEEWRRTYPLLRIYEINNKGREAYHFDVYIDLEARGWYISVPKANTCYRAELGHILPDGTFRPLLTSNSITVPRNAISEIIDPRWPPISAIWVRLGHQISHWGLSSAELIS